MSVNAVTRLLVSEGSSSGQILPTFQTLALRLIVDSRQTTVYLPCHGCEMQLSVVGNAAGANLSPTTFMSRSRMGGTLHPRPYTPSQRGA
jgi:hypothetical protein